MVLLDTALDITKYSRHKHPFPYFISKSAISPERSTLLLSWFDSSESWADASIDDFYELSNMRLSDVPIPTQLQFLTSRRTINLIKTYMSEAFSTTFSDHVEVTAHRMRTGDSIKIHTDHGERQLSHRLLFQINHEWTHEHGGLLLLFDKPDPDPNLDECTVIEPVCGLAFGFEVSPISYHAVSPVFQGVRYTLSYSLVENNE